MQRTHTWMQIGVYEAVNEHHVQHGTGSQLCQPAQIDSEFALGLYHDSGPMTFSDSESMPVSWDLSFSTACCAGKSGMLYVRH